MEPVIRYENVSKRYFLGSHKAYTRYLLPGFIMRRIQQRQQNAQSIEELWALKGLSFEMNRGETLGFVGPNGAGKTTALSLLAGITAPTEGQVTVRGRVSALIRLGAGFHYDLTGRENIYLNGSIMGLRKREIDDLVDEIIDFSELEKFIDTPVKRYSSGMYVRLGFAVAVHTYPEILLVDEVLAVGDAAFKAKCYAKIRDLRENGTTVILVSHDMSQIKNLADRALLLYGGEVRERGDVDSVINAYYKIASEKSVHYSAKMTDDAEIEAAKQGDVALAQITQVSFHNGHGAEADQFATGSTFRIKIGYRTNELIEEPAFGIGLHTVDGTTLFGINTKVDDFHIQKLHGEGTVDFTIPSLSLLPGTYLVSVGFHDRFMGFYDRRRMAYQLNVSAGPVTSGLFCPEHHWQLNADS